MSSALPCLCLDNDRRAVFAGIVNLKGNCAGKKNCHFHSYFDMRKSQELRNICCLLKQSLPNHSLKVLFQHPNPSKGDTYDACSDVCMNLLSLKILEEIHFVYDVKDNHTCWKMSGILDYFVPKGDHKKKLIISDELIVSNEGEMFIHHPIFGTTMRKGWAKMKKGSEHTFHLKY